MNNTRLVLQPLDLTTNAYLKKMEKRSFYVYHYKRIGKKSRIEKDLKISTLDFLRIEKKLISLQATWCIELELISVSVELSR